MKKLNFIILALFLVFMPCMNIYGQKVSPLEYPEPVFDKPFSFVIDSFKEEGTIKDRIILHSFSEDKNISFNVYFHDPNTKEWNLYGTGLLKNVDDNDKVKQTYRKDKTKNEKLTLNFRYYAIESLNNKNYKYQFLKNNNDLNIFIMGPTMGFATTLKEAFSERLEKTVIGMNINTFKEIWPEASLSGMSENNETYDIVYYHMVRLFRNIYITEYTSDYQIIASFYFVNNKLTKYESRRH